MNFPIDDSSAGISSSSSSSAKRSGGSPSDERNAKRTKGPISSDKGEFNTSSKQAVDQRKAVEQLHLTTGEVLRTYPGGSDAALFMGISHGGISLACHGKQTDASGFKWRFYEGSLPIDWDAIESKQTPLEQLKTMVLSRNKRLPSKIAAAAAAKTTTGLEFSPSGGGAAASGSTYMDGDDNENNDSDSDDEGLLVGADSGAGSSSSAAVVKRGRPPGPKHVSQRAPSAYLQFCMEIRSAVVAENPNASFSEIGALLGKKWKDLPESDRLQYKELHETAKTDLKLRQERDGIPAKSNKQKKQGSDFNAAAGSGLSDSLDVFSNLQKYDAAMVDELRRQLKECREELKKRAKVIEKLTEKITELRKIKHTYQKREKRQSLSKDKSSARKEKELATEAFKQQLKELKQKARNGDFSMVKSGTSLLLGAAAAAGTGGGSAASASGGDSCQPAAAATTLSHAGGGASSGAGAGAGGLSSLSFSNGNNSAPLYSSSSSSSSSGGGSSGHALQPPGLIRLPPKPTENINPDNRTRSIEGPQNGEGRFAFIKRGMLRYKELYGTFHPANAFIIPWTDDWPEEFWGYGLGSTVTQIRAGKSYLKRREELEAIGFSYLASILPKYEREYEYSYVRAALVRYQELHDHIRPKSDEVCQGDEWPENLRGFKIGLIAPHIRSGRCWKDHREDLESIGFVFANSAGSDGGGTTKPWMSYEFPFIKRLLVHYAGLHGALQIPRNFVVPATTAWPYDMHGVELGKLVEKIRGGLKKFRCHREEFEELGLEFDNPKGNKKETE